MFITIHRKKWLDQTGWSIGHCPTCNRTEAIRIGRVISTTSLYVIMIVSRQVSGEVSCCDFCGKEATRLDDAEVVGVDQWSYRDGIATLFNLCAPAYNSGPSRFSTQDEVVSLLRATARATSFSKIDLNTQWLPPLIGAVVGATLAIIVGTMLFDDKDRFRVIFLSLIVGLLVGGLLGVIIGGILSSNKVARTTIEYNTFKYDIDRDLLLNSASEFPGRIRRVVYTIENYSPQGD